MKSLTQILAFVILLCQIGLAQTDLSRKTNLSETEKQLISSRGFEAILWASPALAIIAMDEAAKRDLSADNTDIIFTSKSMDYRWELVTYNNQSPYWNASFSLKDGPIVVDIPPAIPEAMFFGSIHDIWFIPLEDFGPVGADKGKGGKYLVLPPGYDRDIPEGYIVLQSNSYLQWIPGRTIPREKGQKGWNAAVDYIKQLKIYPLSQADNPPKQKFIDGAQTKYAALPMFDLNDFKMIERLVQEEPVNEYDKLMLGMLASIGIKKGGEFKPSAEVATILEKAAKDVQAYCIEHIKNGESFHPFWEGSNWGRFKVTSKVAATLGTYVFEDVMAYEDRIFNHFYFSGGMYKSFDATKPSKTAYVWTAQDSDGNALDPEKTYRIHVPPNPPIEDFWSIIAYGAVSRTFINSPKFTVSSNDEDVVVNKDGSIDLYLSPKPVKGLEANTVITSPEEDSFFCFRFYGSTPELFEKKWELGSPKLVK